VFTRVEAAAIAAVSCLAAAVIAAYAAGTVGLALHPFAILLVALAVAATTFTSLWRCATSDRTHAIAFVVVVAGVLAWVLSIAWPPLLPVGSGPDLTHHLLLIDYIDRTGHLVRDPSLGPFLGEMLHYTPGSHLLVVLAGRWSGSDGLHAAHAVIAVTVALKAGILFLIALRCLPAQRARTPLAVLAVLLLFVPRAYFLSSFTQDWFLGQVVSELFAVAMWWAVVAWDQQPSARAAAIVGIAGTAAFLCWPVWVGPLAMTLVAVVWFRRATPPIGKVRHLAVAFAPIATVAAAHASVHYAGVGIASTSGAVVTPSAATMGAVFIALGGTGAIVATVDGRSRTIAVLIAAIALQAAALFALARVSGAQTPYLSMKMFYLAIYPLAVAGAVCIAWALRHVRSAALSGPRIDAGLKAPRYTVTRIAVTDAIAWTLVLMVGIGVARQLAAAPRPTPVITDSLNDAGRWARMQLPHECVDYLVGDDDSAYWLHLAVLGNARSAPRSVDSDTYDPKHALIRWVLPGGLPYAIVEALDDLPKDIQANVDVLERFGRAAVVKRRGASSCES
jgi:hypothetical protein